MARTEIWTIAITAFAVALFLVRRRLGTFLSVALFGAAIVAYLRFGFDPAIPESARKLYLAILLVALLIYVTSSAEMAAAFWAPIRRTIVEPRLRPLLALLLVAIPVLVAWRSYEASVPRAVAPPKIRTVHPQPPSSITFQAPGQVEAKTFDIITGLSPLRALEKSAPDQFRDKVAHGKVVYYENCFYCHGDTLSGDGHLQSGVKPPPPANFHEALSSFTETYFFWRVAKGGPGLPDEATPYDSTMPAWEHFLGEDDIWSAILYLYDYAGVKPRTQEPANPSDTHGKSGATP